VSLAESVPSDATLTAGCPSPGLRLAVGSLKSKSPHIPPPSASAATTSSVAAAQLSNSKGRVSIAFFCADRDGLGMLFRSRIMLSKHDSLSVRTKRSAKHSSWATARGAHRTPFQRSLMSPATAH
jgi:hypothetical protein